MNAIGPETFHGQHRGTGAGLQYTCNRIAGIVVSLSFIIIYMLLFFPFRFGGLILIYDLKLFLGSDYCVIRESDDGGSCLYRGCYDDLWWTAWVVVTV
jgi:hypothetical protein